MNGSPSLSFKEGWHFGVLVGATFSVLSTMLLSGLLLKTRYQDGTNFLLAALAVGLSFVWFGLGLIPLALMSARPWSSDAKGNIGVFAIISLVLLVIGTFIWDANRSNRVAVGQSPTIPAESSSVASTSGDSRATATAMAPLTTTSVQNRVNGCPATFSATMSFNELIAFDRQGCAVPEKLTIAVIGREGFPFRQRSAFRTHVINSFVKNCVSAESWGIEYATRVCGCMAEIHADNITGDDFLAEAENRKTYHAEMLQHQAVQECSRRERESR
jgi:hypothetical protein